MKLKATEGIFGERVLLMSSPASVKSQQCITVKYMRTSKPFFLDSQLVVYVHNLPYPMIAKPVSRSLMMSPSDAIESITAPIPAPGQVWLSIEATIADVSSNLFLKEITMDYGKCPKYSSQGNDN